MLISKFRCGGGEKEGGKNRKRGADFVKMRHYAAFFRRLHAKAPKAPVELKGKTLGKILDGYELLKVLEKYKK